MKLYIKTGLLISIGMTLLLSSCLKSGLPEYPAYKESYINKVYFEYRWADSTNMYNGNPVVAYLPLTVTQTTDSTHNAISLQITVPPVNGSFTAYQRNLVSLNHLWCSVDVSPAATVTPLGDAPRLGFAGDYSKPQQYKVTAADGHSSRNWTLTVTSFVK